MLFNNRMRPAVATAGASANSTVQAKNRLDTMTLYANSEADDFGAFTSDRTQERAPRRDRSTPPPKRTEKKNAVRMWIILIAAIVAVLLIGTVIVAVALNSSNDILYTNNTYLAYVQDNGQYCVSVNGTVLDQDFPGDTRVIPSLDRSFAYVECNATDGYQIYLLEGKKLTALTKEESAVTEVIAYADGAPAVLYEEDGKTWFYNEELGRKPMHNDAENFLLSSDGQCVIYTRQPEGSSATRTYLYRDGSGSSIDGLKNFVPVQLSPDGTYLYGFGDTTTQSGKLYCVTTEDGEKTAVCEANFGGITAMNVAGDEIVYYTVADAKVTSFIYSYKKGNYEIAKSKGIFVPAGDPEVARYGTFADGYLQSTSLASALLDEDTSLASYTFYINKKFEAKQIASAAGKFSPDGKYFYYVNAKSKFLYQVDLNRLEDEPVKIYNDGIVVDFAVTQKGNLYILDKENYLYFRKPSSKRNETISVEATEISMYAYANELYFSEQEDDANVYVTKEGSEAEIAKFGDVELEALPIFNTGDSKNTYAYFYGEDGCSLFYSANGKKFKRVSSECEDVVTDDLLSLVPDKTPSGEGANKNETSTGDGTTLPG